MSGLLARKLGGLLQAELAHAVDDAEIDRLGQAAHIRLDPGDIHAEKLGGGGGMDILVLPEGLQQALILGEMGQDPQIDLRIIAGHENGAGRRDKGLADFPAQFAPDRDILQIGVAGGKPAGGGAGLVEAGMHPSRFGD